MIERLVSQYLHHGLECEVLSFNGRLIAQGLGKIEEMI
jgi:hypothetical protein